MSAQVRVSHRECAKDRLVDAVMLIHVAFRDLGTNPNPLLELGSVLQLARQAKEAAALLEVEAREDFLYLCPADRLPASVALKTHGSTS